VLLACRFMHVWGSGGITSRWFRLATAKRRCSRHSGGVRQRSLMRTMTPSWILTLLWFGAGIGATGAFWYFLSQRDLHATLWSAFVTATVVLLTVTLHIRNDLLEREQRKAVVKPIDAVPDRRPQVFFKHSLFLGPLGNSENMAVDLLLSNSGTTGAKGGFKNISFRFEPAPYSSELRYFAEGAKGTFTLAPSQETHIRIGSKLPVTPEMIAALSSEPPRARLYIYAKGWYSDLEGLNTYDLSFCRIYHPSMPGNLIYCPEDVSVVGL
jgi:hypothetical protein